MMFVQMVVTKEIDEVELFDEIKDDVLATFIGDDDNTLIEELPINVQRTIFAKLGAMMIDYAGSEDFGNEV